MTVDFSTMAPHLLTAFGEPATYTPAAGAGVACTVVVDRDVAEIQDSPDGLMVEIRVPICVPTATVAAPARGDKIAFPRARGGAAVDWTVASDPAMRGDGFADVIAYRQEAVERSAQGHRTER